MHDRVRSFGQSDGWFRAIALACVLGTRVCSVADGREVGVMPGSNSRASEQNGRRVPLLVPVLRLGTERFSHGDSRDLAVSADGKLLASAGRNSTRVFDSRTGEVVREIAEPAVSVAFHPTEQLLAVGGEEEELLLVGYGEEESVKRIKSPGRWIDNITFFPEGDRLVWGALADTEMDDWLCIWDIERERYDVSRLLELHSHYGLSLMSASQRIAAGSTCTFGLWALTDRNQLSNIYGNKSFWKECEGDIDSFLPLPDERRVAVASTDGSILIWSITERKAVRTLQTQTGTKLASGIYYGDSRALAATSDCKYLLSGGADAVLRVWDPEDSLVVHEFRGHARRHWSYGITSICVFPDNRTVATACIDSTIRLWQLEPEFKALSPIERPTCVNAAAFSSDGRTIATAGLDRLIRIWDAATGEELQVLRGHTASVEDLQFARNGKELLSASRDGSIRVWDPSNGRLTRSFGWWHGPVSSIDISANGDFLVSANDDMTISVWDWQAGRELTTIERKEFDFRVRRVRLSPNGEQVASFAQRGMYVWISDIKRRQCVFTLRCDYYGSYVSVPALDFSPDGRMLAVGLGDSVRTGLVEVWNLKNRKPLFRKHLERAPVVPVRFSPDGQWLAYGGEAGELRLRNMETNKELVLHGHSFAIASIAFSADGRRIVTGSRDTTALVWDISSLAHLDSE